MTVGGITDYLKQHWPDKLMGQVAKRVGDKRLLKLAMKPPMASPATSSAISPANRWRPFPPAMYRMGKFVRKHRAALSTAAAFMAFLIAGVTVSTIEARLAQRRFSQVRKLANTFLFQFYDQVTPLAGSVEVRKSVVDTARKYLDGLSKEAGNDKDLILELAQAYQRLGDVQARPGTANLGQVDEARAAINALWISTPACV